ncbi:MAG TPA: tRNA glutamyl-Q(34) synthetase GluQRS [Terriglobales bacterium]|nr:tRNA glutamyl-Q(34) synthetase GluQRS [Terriglobales bacterium]
MHAVSTMPASPYRGRLAPSPTGLLHIGHACTFWTAYQRAVAHSGTLVFRNEDLDPQRSKPSFAEAMIEDLCWLGIRWQEGPDVGGPFAPYEQSRRREFYLAAWRKLRDGGFIYPCTCSRKDLALAAAAPNEGDDEPLYPGRCRDKIGEASRFETPAGVNWRFRVSNGKEITFDDLHLGPRRFLAGEDFGDFVVWRRDDVPAYQLAVVADDAAMQITEVVRGADLLKSTARQVLLIRALGFPVPAYYHCDLVRDEAGARLAKRHDALSLGKLREQGYSPQQVLSMCTPR